MFKNIISGLPYSLQYLKISTIPILSNNKKKKTLASKISVITNYINKIDSYDLIKKKISDELKIRKKQLIY